MSATQQSNVNREITSPLIEMRDVVKIYSTAAGDFDALKGINLQVNEG